MSDAQALVIDEPTASLDRTSADRVIAELQALASAGRTGILASHDQNFLAVADQVIRLEGQVR